MINILQRMLAAVTTDTDIYASDEAFDYATAAFILRYEKVCAKAVQDTINGHIFPIVTRDAARRARDSYDRVYLLNLNIPYSGIQSLCQELVRAFRRHGVVASDVQLAFAKGLFDWKSEYESLSSTNEL